MPNNLGQVTLCESHVNTRLRYVHKLEGTYGFPKSVEIQLSYFEQRIYVNSVPTDSNAPNGALTMKDTACGVDSPPLKERISVANVT